MYLAVLALLLASCMPPAVAPTHAESVDERLWTAVHTFEEAFQIEVKNKVSVEDLSRFDDEYPVFGTCGLYSGVVRIDSRALEKSWAFLEMRVWHELGHCYFGLPHVNEPCSIMREHGASHDFALQFERNRECFIEHMRGLVE